MELHQFLSKTVENNGAKVDFGTIKYNKEGTYYYRITETGKAATTSGEYTLDSQSYVVKIVVTANVTSSGNITTTEYNKVTTYYKGDTVNACTEENKVTGTTGITFNNETIEQKGNLKIVKAAGAGTNLVGKTFYFKISDENGNVVKIVIIVMYGQLHSVQMLKMQLTLKTLNLASTVYPKQMQMEMELQREKHSHM